MMLDHSVSSQISTAIAKHLIRAYLTADPSPSQQRLEDIDPRLFPDIFEHRALIRFFLDVADRILRNLSSSIEYVGNANLNRILISAQQCIATPVPTAILLAAPPDPSVIADMFKSGYSPDDALQPTTSKSISDRLLDQAARHIVAVISVLPPFESGYVSESLVQLEGSMPDIIAAISVTSNIEQQLPDLIRAAHDTPARLRYEADFRLAVMRSLDKVELFGADIRPEAQRNLLTEAFVSLNVRYNDSDHPVLLPFAAVLNRLSHRYGRLLIRGAAGSGKSTLLRWAALRVAEVGSKPYYTALTTKQERIADIYDSGEDIPAQRLAELDDEVGMWRNRIPFLIPLRTYTDGHLPTPEAFPDHISGGLGAPPADWVQSILRNGRALVLIDGIDEVPVLNRPAVKDALRELIREYASNYYVITTRPEAVPHGWLSDLVFREAEVSPMSTHDTARFIRKWHDAVKRELCRRGRPIDEIDALAEHLIDSLRNDASIAPLATNPLLCAMICALHQYRFGKLPETLRSLCEALSEMLLHRRERESGLDVDAFPYPWPELQYDQKRTIVQALAYYMVTREQSTITSDEAYRVVAHELEQIPNRRPAEATVILRALVERSGMLREVRPETHDSQGVMDFLHNTFKEFLAGERFAHRGEEEILAENYLRDPTWRRVALFAVAANAGEFPSRFIGRVLATALVGDSPPQQCDRTVRRARELFCLQCRANALRLDPDLNKRLEVLLTEVFPPQLLEDGELIATLGEVAVPFPRPRDDSTAEGAAASVRALRLINTIQARAMLQRYLKDERDLVVQELAQWINPLSIPKIKNLVREGAILPEGIREQIADLEPLSEMKQLSRLNLSYVPIKHLSGIKELQKLRKLDISGTEVTDLSFITDVPALAELNVDNTGVTNIMPLAQMTMLTTLSAAGAPIFDFRPLSRLKSLRNLDLSKTRIRDLLRLKI